MEYEEDRQSEEFDYLSVDHFIKDIVGARALSTAFELRLIDYLINNQPVSLDELKKGFKATRRGHHSFSICSWRTTFLRNRTVRSD
jgi:hypothetical protein